MARAGRALKLLVVSNLFHPDRGGGASVFTDLCCGLAERGHEVTVFAMYPYYPEWRNKSRANLWRVARERLNGLEIHRYGMFVPKNPSQLGPRLLFELSFALGLSRSLFSRRRYDAVMVFCPAMGAVAYGAARKLIRHEPMWLNVQDLPADAAAASGMGRSRATQRAGQIVQSTLFNRADVWSSIAPRMVERLETLTRRSQPVHLVPNFLNGSIADLISAHSPKIGRPPSLPIKLLYAGNIGKKQNLVAFCRRLAATHLDFVFSIHGDGGEVDGVREWVASAKDARFRFGPFLTENDYVDALFQTDLFVITETPDVGASFMPSKLIPCIASGTPVVSICDHNGPLGLEVERFRLGIALDWSEIDELASFFRHLAEEPAAFAELQRNAIVRATTYSRGPVIASLERELEALVSGDGRR